LPYLEEHPVILLINSAQVETHLVLGDLELPDEQSQGKWLVPYNME
jgi:hypothetical protein